MVGFCLTLDSLYYFYLSYPLSTLGLTGLSNLLLGTSFGRAFLLGDFDLGTGLAFVVEVVVFEA